MSEHVYKSVELTGTSTKGIEEAIARAVEKASATVRHMRWFEVLETRGEIRDGKIQHWQVIIKVGFTLEE